MTAMIDQSRPILLDLELPERFKKAEIIRGAAVMSPLRSGHNMTFIRVMIQLEPQVPADMGFVSDVLTPFPADDCELCPDLAIVPRAQAEANISICDPELIAVAFEVISPSTRSIDYSVKTGVYARAGIPEYVIFDPYARSATRYALPEDGEYTLRQVVHYGNQIVLENPFRCVIETKGLPVDPLP
jgi:Uma2 family endonuclease